MYVIEARNIRDALPKAVSYLLHYGKHEFTRVGDALVARRPVTIHYRYPKQHVLLNAIRDANPFFHLMEAMWMLAGRQDGAFLDNYIKNFSQDFGVDGVIQDSYGYRWRHGCEFDQLEEIIHQLRENPTTRQCVLQMWGAGRADLLAEKMKPCNLVATFRINDNQLDMTVFNRSNDIVWGCCGANAVHFPIMQEYVAAMVRVKVGGYWQITTNLHLYKLHEDMMLKRVGNHLGKDLNHYLKDPSDYGLTHPLVSNIKSFDDELLETMSIVDDIHNGKEIYVGDITNPFLSRVVIPMARAYRHYRLKDVDSAILGMYDVIAYDWQQAGREWLKRRWKHDKVPHDHSGSSET